MGVISAAARELIAAGLSGEDLVRALDRIEDAHVVVDVMAERRRAKDRERKREAKSADSAEFCGNDTPETKVSPHTPLTKTQTPEIAPLISPQPKPTPRGELLAVLDEERAKAVVDHRQRIGKPLTAHAARLLGAKLAQWPDPNEAADTMIERGWQGFSPEWMHDRARGQPPPGSRRNPSILDEFDRIIEHERTFGRAS